MKHLICIVAVLVAFAFGVCSGWKCSGRNEVLEEAKVVEWVRDTVTVRDTVEVAVLEPVSVRGGGYVECAFEEVVSGGDSVRECGDSVLVRVPLDTLVYAGDGYRAVVSGFNARLDSLNLFEECRYVTERVAVKRGVGKRWALTVGLGVGYGTRGLVPGVYVGVGYVLGSW